MKFGSQLPNITSWENIKAVLETMEAGRWHSVWFYDHFLPPVSHTDGDFPEEFVKYPDIRRVVVALRHRRSDQAFASWPARGRQYLPQPSTHGEDGCHC